MRFVGRSSKLEFWSNIIAARLGISTDAVNQHISAARVKLGATNRNEAVAIALRKHLLKM